jgi:methanogenic corrinoid protein MtbC1
MNKGRNPGKTNSVSAARLKKLIQLVVDLKETQCIAEVNDMLDAGSPPQDLLDSCLEGMQEIGQRFEDGRYYISALIMAGAIMRQITELLEPHLETEKTAPVIGTLLLGTVAGDIHDLGKNLFAILARCKGIHVIDLGVDVPPATFLSKAQEHKPTMIGISCVLTTGWPKLEETVSLLHKHLPEPRPSIIIGGTSIDEHVCRHVNSDFCVRDASEGLAICHRVMNKSENTAQEKTEENAQN